MRTAAIEVRIGGNHQRANVHFGERCKSCSISRSFAAVTKRSAIPKVCSAVCNDETCADLTPVLRRPVEPAL